MRAGRARLGQVSVVLPANATAGQKLQAQAPDGCIFTFTVCAPLPPLRPLPLPPLAPLPPLRPRRADRGGGWLQVPEGVAAGCTVLVNLPPAKESPPADLDPDTWNPLLGTSAMPP